MSESTSVFGAAAHLYDRVRPGYPPALFDDIAALAGLPHGARVLEIGPGTGQATLPLAQRGYSVLAVELDSGLAAIARQKLAGYGNVEVRVGNFDDMALPQSSFDLVLAATAFHWLDPATRYQRSAASLKTGGALAVVNNRHVAGGTKAFFEESQACYRAHWPGSTGITLPRPEALRPETADLVASGLFHEPEVRPYLWQETYEAETYLDLLRTYSDVIRLQPEAREALFACLESLIERRFEGRIAKQYMTELILARKA